MLRLVLLLALGAQESPIQWATGFSLDEAIRGSLASPAVGLEIVEVRSPVWPRGCVAASAKVERPIASSGRYPVKLEGAGCHGWIWVSVKVVANVRVATRALKPGDPLAEGTTLGPREITQGHTPLVDLADGLIAAAPIAAGQLIEPHQVRQSGTAPGESVQVEVHSGSVSILQSGRAVPCVRGRACAVLPSGRRLEGRIQNGRLVVEIP
jgi:hypothetical protein